MCTRNPGWPRFFPRIPGKFEVGRPGTAAVPLVNLTPVQVCHRHFEDELMSEARNLQTLLIHPGSPQQPATLPEAALPRQLVDFLQDPSGSSLNLFPAVAVPSLPGGCVPSAVGLTDVVAMIDAAAGWQELLVPCIAAARCESARLLVLVLPSETGSSRLDEVRQELQCHDIRTLPAGVRCIATPALLAELLTELLPATPRPLLVFRSGSVAAAVATVELVMRVLENGVEVCERRTEWLLTVAGALGPLQPKESTQNSQKR